VHNAQNTPPPPETYASGSTTFYLTRYTQTEEEAWRRVEETQNQIHEAGKVLADLRAFECLRPYLKAKAMLNPTLAEVLQDVDIEDQSQQSH
jgi:TfoX/Sxy family transcriptional regulator of competence genes